MNGCLCGHFDYGCPACLGERYDETLDPHALRAQLEALRSVHADAQEELAKLKEQNALLVIAANKYRERAWAAEALAAKLSGGTE